MAAIASLYGDEVILASVNGDASTDKDDEFAERLSGLLTHIYAPPHFPSGEHKILLPMKHRSKVEWVQHYLMTGGSAAMLQRSTSCYHPEHWQCGVCKACIRKWVALEANGVMTTGWRQHPSTFDWAPLFSKIQDRKWRCDAEDAATEYILRKYGVMK